MKEIYDVKYLVAQPMPYQIGKFGLNFWFWLVEFNDLMDILARRTSGGLLYEGYGALNISNTTEQLLLNVYYPYFNYFVGEIEKDAELFTFRGDMKFVIKLNIKADGVNYLYLTKIVFSLGRLDFYNRIFTILYQRTLNLPPLRYSSNTERYFTITTLSLNTPFALLKENIRLFWGSDFKKPYNFIWNVKIYGYVSGGNTHRLTLLSRAGKLDTYIQLNLSLF